MTAHAHQHDDDHAHDHDAHDHARGGHSHGGHSHGGHSHGHSHAGHSHAPSTFGRAFAIGIALNLVFVLAEFVFGVRAHSVALTADAGHNLGDVLGLGLAWTGTILATRAPTPRRTYGLRRFSILAALGNGALLLVAVGAIGLEAIQRLLAPQPVASGIVIVVALVGIAINLGTALLFMRGREHDVNIRGAFLHMMGDAAASVGVVIAQFAMRMTGWLWIDPAVGIALVGLITWSTWGLIRESLDLALDAVPVGIDPTEVTDYLAGLPGVREVHDLHIWGMSTTNVALTAHLIRPDGIDDDALLARACRDLHLRFGIEHSTIQIERGHGANPCGLAPSEVI